MINIQEQVDLKPFNTFGISTKAKYFTSITSTEELQLITNHDLFKKEKVYILGGGSNVLLTGDVNGLVIKISIKGIETIDETEESITLKVGAGEVWHEFVLHCIKNNWGGIENLSLIPGTVGAAPMQNIGAYGVEVKEVINLVEGVDAKSGKLLSFTNEECNFGYRESIFKHELKEKIFISSVTLTLTKKNHKLITSYGAVTDTLKELGYTHPTIQSISEAVIKIRSQKLPDPSKVGNAGSFFKNPTITEAAYEVLKSTYPTIPGYKIENQHVKVPAAWLIEQCHWKGFTKNHVGVHQHQPLVLVNIGNATGKEVWDLALNIQSSVKEKFGVLLQPEVNIL